MPPKCRPDQILNPVTNRCVLKRGKIGQQLLNKKPVVAVQTPKSPYKYKYSFSNHDDKSVSSIRNLLHFLQSVPLAEYSLHWNSGDDHISIKKINRLGSCANPDRKTYAGKFQVIKGFAGHFRSLSGKSRLVVPVKSYTHLACFVNESTFPEFKDLIQLIHSVVKDSRLGTKLEIFTHGQDIDWLHVKVQPDPYS